MNNQLEILEAQRDMLQRLVKANSIDALLDNIDTEIIRIDRELLELKSAPAQFSGIVKPYEVSMIVTPPDERERGITITLDNNRFGEISESFEQAMTEAHNTGHYVTQRARELNPQLYK